MVVGGERVVRRMVFCILCIEQQIYFCWTLLPIRRFEEYAGGVLHIVCTSTRIKLLRKFRAITWKAAVGAAVSLE